MLELDGKPIDLTKPQTWGDSIKIKPNGYIEQTKDGVTTKLTHQPWCASLNTLLLSHPPQPARCNCSALEAQL